MTKYLIPLAAILMLVAMSLQAERITPDQARQAAAQFLQSRNLPTPAEHAAPQRARATEASAPYYVFNTQADNGFVIIAGDDQVTPVLGYSDSGTFDPGNVPPAMQAMLDSYEAQINILSSGEIQRTRHITDSPIKSIMNCHWGQGAPYNRQLPVVQGTQAVTGCVATALAQVMYHHKWPARPTATIPQYTTKTYSIVRPALSPTDFQWSLMKPFHLEGGDENANEAVATLMTYCDQALEMNLQKGVSSASTNSIPTALTTYFAYNAATIKYVQRTNYTTLGWESLIYDEIKNNRPVILRGDKDPGGHAFVCDGYAGDGLFHINWGWNSLSDGYYLLSLLDPSDQGTGSSDQPWGYIFGSAAVVGIQPGTGSEATEYRLTCSNVSYASATTTRNATGDNFTINATARFSNGTNVTGVPDFGWGLYKDGNLVNVVRSSWFSSLKPGYYGQYSWDLNFGSGITSGTYQLYPICRSVHGQGEWLLCYGAEANHIEVTFNGNQCTINGVGTAGITEYLVDNLTFEGTLNNGKKVGVNLNLSNVGTTAYNLIYMYVDGVRSGVAGCDIEPGGQGEVYFHFTPTTAGVKNLTFSLNSDGSTPFYAQSLTVNSMATYTIGTGITPQNTSGTFINAKSFKANVLVRNTGTKTYREDITAKIYRINSEGGTSGTLVQTKTQNLTLSAYKTATISFDMDNVYDGQRYFMIVYYYSNGSEVRASNSSSFTMRFPAEFNTGDVNGDGKVDIDDINILINILLGKDTASKYDGRADINGDKKTDIQDVNQLVNLVLSK